MPQRREFLRAMTAVPLASIGDAAGAGGFQDSDAKKLLESSIPVAAPSSKPHSTPFSPEIGSPDKPSNLLGNVDAASLQDIANAVQSELASHSGSTDVHNWLKTFSTPFDDRVRGIVKDAHIKLLRNSDHSDPPLGYRFEPQLFEASLLDASQKLDRCMRYRDEMGDCEIGGINAGLSYLAFVKSAQIQLDLIRKSSIADLASMEGANSQAVSEKYERFFDARTFSWTDLVEVAAWKQEAQGTVAESELIVTKEVERTDLIERQFRIQTDMQLKRFRRFLSPGSSSNFSERYNRTLHLLEEDLTDAYIALYTAAQGIVSLFNSRKSTFVAFPVNGHSQVELVIPPLNSDDGIKAWLANFSREGTIANDRVDLLDALVLWCRGVMRELDRRSQYESDFTIAIPVKTGDLSAHKGEVPEFTLSYSSFPEFMRDKALRVVGFGLSVQHDDRDQVPVQEFKANEHANQAQLQGTNAFGNTSPEPYDSQYAITHELVGYRMSRLTATVRTPSQPVGTDKIGRPLAILTNVRLLGGMSGDLEPELCYGPAFQNINPFNDGWRITLIQYNNNPMDLDAKANDSWAWVKGIVLYLRIRGSF